MFMSEKAMQVNLVRLAERMKDLKKLKTVDVKIDWKVIHNSFVLDQN